MGHLTSLPHHRHNPEVPRVGSYERYALEMMEFSHKAYESSNDVGAAHYARMAQVYAALAGKQRF